MMTRCSKLVTSRRARASGIALIAMVALTTAACKGESTPSAGGAGVGTAGAVVPPATGEAPGPSSVATVADACKVFTAADVSAAFGVEVNQSASNTASKTADGLPLTSCRWEQGGANPNDYVINFQADNFLSAEPRAKGFFNDSRVSGGSLSFAELSGLGDEALYYRMDHAKPVQAQIGWRKGNVVFTLGVVRLAGLEVAAAEAKLLALAKQKY